MFFPIHDANTLRRIKRPIVTWLIIATTTSIYLVFQAGASASDAALLTFRFGAIPSVVSNLAVLSPEYALLPPGLSLITYGFLHGNMAHLLGNMLFLWVFGDNVEDAMGHRRFLFFYLVCTVIGAMTYVLSVPNSDTPLIGASGAISGIVAAYLMLHPKVKLWFFVFGPIPLRLRTQWVLGAWIVLQVYNAATQASGLVAWTAHLGGLVAGALLIVVIRLPGTPLFDRSPP